MFAWIKKWWLAIVGVLAAGFALVARFFPRRNNKHLIERTKADVDLIKASAVADIEKQREKSRLKREELKRITAINNERERLKKLAEFMNKKGNP